MLDLAQRLLLDSDGLWIGFAAGAILAGVLVAPIAFEAGRRRAEEAAREAERDASFRAFWESPRGRAMTDAAVVPEWPRERT